MLPPEACIVLHSKNRTDPAGPGGGVDAAAFLHQPLHAFLIRHPEFLFLQGFFVVVFRSVSDARNIVTMRTGYEHQRSVVFVVIRENDGAAYRAHSRHPILDVPRFEIGMPVKFFSFESGLKIDARLHDVRLAAEQILHDMDDSFMSGKLLEKLGALVYVEDGTNVFAVRLANHFVVVGMPVFVHDALQFFF